MKLRLASPISRQLVPIYESSHAAPRIRIRRSAPATARSWNEPYLPIRTSVALDDHGDLVSNLELQPLDRTVGNRCHHLASLDLDLDLGHDCAGLDAHDLALELISSADLHDTPPTDVLSTASSRIDPNIGGFEGEPNLASFDKIQVPQGCRRHLRH